MPLLQLRFHFTSPLHVHGERSDYDKADFLIHNDSLYAAVISSLATLGHSIDEPPRMVFSSMMPFVQGPARYHYFFPRPKFVHSSNQAQTKAQTSAHSKGEQADRKAYKKMQWVEWELLQEFIAGDTHYLSIDKVTSNQLWGELAFHQPVANQWKEAYSSPLFVREQSARNQISREGGDTRPFYAERIRFHAHSGLFALVSLPEASVPLLRQALDYLQDAGLGTDRSVGNGAFQYTIESDWIMPPIHIQATGQVGGYVSLGMFLPPSVRTVQAFEQNPSAGWDIVRRGGWMGHEPYIGLLKKQIYMFAPGAFLPVNELWIPEGGIGGCIVDLAPQQVKHPVWRSGETLFVAVQAQP